MNIGDIVNYQVTKQKKYKAIITQIIEPSTTSNEEHGMVELWLYSTEGYGDNNCEHFSYDYFQEKVNIIKSKQEDCLIGYLVETEYGLGLVVKELEEDYYQIFLYNEDNNYDPEFNNNEEDVDFDIKDLVYIEPKFIKDLRFDKLTHCIKLNKSEFKIKQ
tara:strand:- start:3351 stop:3830 length:480 start_codon:yes stop_codon:yes gene_type:complete